MIFSNPLGRLVLLAIIALPLWKGAHHTRPRGDMLGHHSDALVGGSTRRAIGSVLGILAVLAI
jgi:fumarate reductase subunit D